MDSVRKGSGIPLWSNPRPLTKAKGLHELDLEGNLRLLFVYLPDGTIYFVGVEDHKEVKSLARRHKGNGVFSSEELFNFFTN